MEEDEFDMPGEWDEFQWERFLQEQDRATEKYFGLIEKYFDHPDRDALVAGEMGWNLFAESDDDCVSAMEQTLDQDQFTDDSGMQDDPEYFDSPVYRDVTKLCMWVEMLFEKHSHLQENKFAIQLASRTAVCSAKLAAALSREEDEEVELGMTIAYLKRGLKAANDALESASQLAGNNLVSETELRVFHKRLFRVRDQIVDLMRESRGEWIRRHGREE